ncbi:hypothetical protein GVAV_001050 [Gurleya vavrai]
MLTDLQKFSDFLQLFIQEDNFYIPKDMSHNHYRHFGIKKNKKLFLYIEDVFYLFNIEQNLLNDIYQDKKHISIFRVYFYTRSRGFNLFRNFDCYEIFIRTADFNRNHAKKLADMYFVMKDDNVICAFEKENQENIFAVLGEEIFALLSFSTVNYLEKTCTKSFLKKNK